MQPPLTEAVRNGDGDRQTDGGDFTQWWNCLLLWKDVCDFSGCSSVWCSDCWITGELSVYLTPLVDFPKSLGVVVGRLPLRQTKSNTCHSKGCPADLILESSTSSWGLRHPKCQGHSWCQQRVHLQSVWVKWVAFLWYHWFLTAFVLDMALATSKANTILCVICLFMCIFATPGDATDCNVFISLCRASGTVFTAIDVATGQEVGFLCSLNVYFSCRIVLL